MSVKLSVHPINVQFCSTSHAFKVTKVSDAAKAVEGARLATLRHHLVGLRTVQQHCYLLQRDAQMKAEVYKLEIDELKAHVFLIAHRRVIRPERKGRPLLKQKRPMSRTLKHVHEKYLEDMIWPQDVVGQKQVYEVDKDQPTEHIYLDPSERATTEHRPYKQYNLQLRADARHRPQTAVPHTAHTAPHGATRRHTAPHGIRQRHTAPHGITRRHTAPHGITRRHTASHGAARPHTAPHGISPVRFAA